MSYFSTTLRGMTWTTALRGVYRGLNLLRTAILARILLPVQFGAFGIATLALGLLEIITETGINTFLIQEKEDWKSYVNTAWAISIFRGVLISLLIFTFAPLISGFFKSPASLPLLYLTAVIPLIRGLINPSCIMFQKELQFNKEFYYRSAVNLVESLAVIIGALITRSAQSFVVGMIIAAVFEVIISFIFTRPHPVWEFNIAKFRRIISQGKWITGVVITDYIYTQGDNITVGRLLGEASLGIYQSAYKLSTLPITEISDIFYRVTFPTFVKISQDSLRLKRVVTKTFAVMTLLVITMALLVFSFARPLVLFILGPNWTEAIPVVKVLAFMGAFRSISYGFNALFVSQGLQKYVTYLIFTSMMGLVVTIIPAVMNFGILGAGYSAIFASIIAIPVAFGLAVKVLRKM
jgi:O-antigen/teichoic acid export membrane protein